MSGVNVLGVLTEHWQTVLGTADVSPEDDFFALGGNSLLAVALVERVEPALGIPFPVEALFFDGRFGAVLDACEQRISTVAP